MDIFEKYIIDNKRNEKCRALTCDSFKNFYQKNHKEPFSHKTNFELATYGDALLKFALCSIFLDKESPLSKAKEQYETDRYLIEVVAKHYNLLEYMNFDRDDTNIRQEYVSDEKDNTKYIATTVEAVLGAVYRQENDFKSICELVQTWIEYLNK